MEMCTFDYSEKNKQIAGAWKQLDVSTPIGTSCLMFDQTQIYLLLPIKDIY